MMEFIRQIRAAARPFRFADAIDIAASSMTPGEIRSAWRRARHGRAVLESDARLNDYLVAYGEAHVAKVRKFLPSVPFDEMKSLVIVDWGCGQGLATAVTLEYVRNRFPEVPVVAVRLIEISNAARARAHEIVSRFENCSDVKVFSWNLDVLSIGALDLPVGIPVLHLFSNILDVVQKELSTVARIVDQSAYGRSCHVLCVGPKECSVDPIRIFYNKFEEAERRVVSDRNVVVAGRRYWPFETCSCYGVMFDLIEHAIHVPLPEVGFYPEDLFAFASADMADGVRKAVLHGVGVDSADADGLTALVLAAEYGAEDALRALVDLGGDINHQTSKGASALYFAAKYGETECVRYLLSVGAKTDPVVIQSGLTPALVAAKYGHVECLTALREAGCNMEACDARGRDVECLLRLFSCCSNGDAGRSLGVAER